MTEPAIKMAQSYVSKTHEFATSVYNQGIIDGTANLLVVIEQTEGITVEDIKDMCKSFIGKTLDEDTHLSCPPVLADIIKPTEEDNPLNEINIDSLSPEELAEMVHIPEEIIEAPLVEETTDDNFTSVELSDNEEEIKE